MADQLGLFNQYDNEYCSKSTDVAQSVEKIKALSGGEPKLCLLGFFCLVSTAALANSAEHYHGQICGEQRLGMRRAN